MGGGTAGEDFFTVGSIWANMFPPSGVVAGVWDSGLTVAPLTDFSSGVLEPDLSGVLERSLLGVFEPALSGVFEPALSGVFEPDLSGVFEPELFGVLEPVESDVFESGLSETVFGALFSKEFFESSLSGVFERDRSLGLRTVFFV